MNDPEYRRVVIRKNEDVLQTFLLDGVVAGTWTTKDGRVALEPFAPLPRAARRELENEAYAPRALPEAGRGLRYSGREH